LWVLLRNEQRATTSPRRKQHSSVREQGMA
jgi:hypothetical protein